MIIRVIKAITAGLLIACLASSVLAQSVHELAKGSAERRQILDSVRGQVESEMGVPVEFIVTCLRATSGWAFGQLEPQRPGGAAIDPADTAFADRGDMMDGLTIFALFKRDGDDWVLVDHVVGPTDVAYVDWPDRYGAPAVIFGFD